MAGFGSLPGPRMIAGPPGRGTADDAAPARSGAEPSAGAPRRSEPLRIARPDRASGAVVQIEVVRTVVVRLEFGLLVGDVGRAERERRVPRGLPCHRQIVRRPRVDGGLEPAAVVADV